MSWIKRIFVATLVVLIFLWGILFSIENTAQLPLNLVFLELPQARVSFWIVGSFICGGIAGLLFSLVLIGQLKAKVIRLNRQLERNVAPPANREIALAE